MCFKSTRKTWKCLKKWIKLYSNKRFIWSLPVEFRSFSTLPSFSADIVSHDFSDRRKSNSALFSIQFQAYLSINFKFLFCLHFLTAATSALNGRNSVCDRTGKSVCWRTKLGLQPVQWNHLVQHMSLQLSDRIRFVLLQYFVDELYNIVRKYFWKKVLKLEWICSQ